MDSAPDLRGINETPYRKLKDMLLISPSAKEVLV
jgi:hypothetical protein